MTDKEQLILNYRDFMSKPLEVFEVFKDYFGEDRVDLQGIVSEETFVHFMSNNPDEDQQIIIGVPTIYVWFPTVKVTNENDKSIMIQDLYVQVKVGFNGTLRDRFYMNRATYPSEQWDNDYQHSHMHGIDKEELSRFRSPCTGDGPINNTMMSLLTDCDKDLWMLFCSELDDFTQVESLKGIPYRYLEDVTNKILSTENNSYNFMQRGSFCTLTRFQPFQRSMMRDFTRHLLKSRVFKFEFVGDSYSIGMPFKDFAIMVSNIFIDWFNSKDNPYNKYLSKDFLINTDIFHLYMIKNGMLYLSNEQDIGERDYSDYNGKTILRFKNKEVKLRIIQNNNTPENSITLLNLEIIKSIASAILKTINLKYGREEVQERVALLSGEAYYI